MEENKVAPPEGKNNAMERSRYLQIGFINLWGQKGFKKERSKMLEDWIIRSNLDIVMCQEAHIIDESFSNCTYINENYCIIINNLLTKYGTCCLVSNSLEIENIRYDNVGRVIIFDIPDLQLTAGNVYLPCGMDRETKANREEYSAKILPELLINSLQYGTMGGIGTLSLLNVMLHVTLKLKYLKVSEI